jgi:NAD kinase
MRSSAVRSDGGGAAAERMVLNEVVVERGPCPYLVSLDCFCDGHYFTTVQACGRTLWHRSR